MLKVLRLNSIYRILIFLPFAIAIFLPILIIAPQESLAATFTVNSNADDDDLVDGDGVCETALAECTLRAAIQEANGLAGPAAHTINFDGAYVIEPATTLPAITHNLVIDGGVADGEAPIVMLKGDTNNVEFALRSDSAPVIIRGLSIVGFDIGIQLASSIDSEIYGNYIGLETDGSTYTPNTFDGISMSAVDTVFIGSEESPNVIAGSEVGINASNSSVAIDIIANLIGTLPDGTLAEVGNQTGIRLNDVTASTIVGNTIADSDFAGINIANSELLLINGNKIGTDSTGMVAAESDTGIVISGDSTMISIGAIDEGRNIISGNEIGIYIEGQDNDPDLGPDFIEINNNYIGTDILGTSALPNEIGIQVHEANNIEVGTTVGNLISGNNVGGIYLSSICPADLASGTIVSNNRIGTDANSLNVLGNGTGVRVSFGECSSYANVSNNTIVDSDEYGIYISQSSDGIITENFIGDNDEGGIYIGDDSAGNVIQANYIGVDPDEGNNFGNDGPGIEIDEDVVSGIYGGFEENEMNVIAYNEGAGIFDHGTGIGIKPNLIFSNAPYQGVDLLANGGTSQNDDDTTCLVDCIINHPVLTDVENDGAGNISISGIIRNAFENFTYIIEFFGDPSADPTEIGQAKYRLIPNEDNSITTDADGNLDFNFTFDDIVDVQAVFTAQLFEGEDPEHAASEFGPRPTSVFPAGPFDFRSYYYMTSENELTLADEFDQLDDEYTYAIILQQESPGEFGDESQNLISFINALGEIEVCSDLDCSNATRFEGNEFPMTATLAENLYSQENGYHIQYLGYIDELDYPTKYTEPEELAPRYLRATNSEYDLDVNTTSFSCDESIYFEFSHDIFASNTTNGEEVSIIVLGNNGDEENVVLIEIDDTGIFRGSLPITNADIIAQNGSLQHDCAEELQVSASLFGVEVSNSEVVVLQNFDDLESEDDFGDLYMLNAADESELIEDENGKYLRQTNIQGEGIDTLAFAASTLTVVDAIMGERIDAEGARLQFRVRVSSTDSFGITPPGFLNNVPVEGFTMANIASDLNEVCAVQIPTGNFINNEFVYVSALLSTEVFNTSIWNDADCESKDYSEFMIGGYMIGLDDDAPITADVDSVSLVFGSTVNFDLVLALTISDNDNNEEEGQEDAPPPTTGTYTPPPPPPPPPYEPPVVDPPYEPPVIDPPVVDPPYEPPEEPKTPDDNDDDNGENSSSNSDIQVDSSDTAASDTLRSSAPELINEYNQTDILLFADDEGVTPELIDKQIYLSRYYFPHKSEDHNFVILGGIYNDDQARTVTLMASTPDGLVKLGTTRSSANGLFYYINETYLEPGTYEIYAFYRPLFGSQVASETLNVEINPDFDTKIPLSLDEFSGKSFAEISRGGKLVFPENIDLYAQGQTESGAQVLGLWSSLLSSSQVLADLSNGQYYLVPDKLLERGKHKILLISYDLAQSKSSEPLELEYRIGRDNSLVIILLSILGSLIVILAYKKLKKERQIKKFESEISAAHTINL